MQMNLDPRNGSSTFLKQPLQEMQRCPQCESVFLDDGECESCGLQLDFDSLGDPLGEKSFYTMRESYWESLGPITNLHVDFETLDPKRRSRYQRKLLFRYNVLLDYLYNMSEFRMNDRNLYLQEFTDLIIELVCYSVSEEDLWSGVNKEGDSSQLQLLHSKIKNAIELGKQEKKEASSFLLKTLNYRLWGTFRIGVIAVTFLGSFGVISAALSLYRYMLLNY